MSSTKLPALRTMVKIRLRRQAELDSVTAQAHAELNRLINAADDASSACNLIRDQVRQQASKVEELTGAGARIQIAQYLAEQDFLSSLSDKAQDCQKKLAEAESLVSEQHHVVKKAKQAASNNETQREQLSERIRSILAKADLAQLDRQDEDAEEANIVLTRRRRQIANDLASGSDHA